MHPAPTCLTDSLHFPDGVNDVLLGSKSSRQIRCPGGDTSLAHLREYARFVTTRSRRQQQGLSALVPEAAIRLWALFQAAPRLSVN